MKNMKTNQLIIKLIFIIRHWLILENSNQFKTQKFQLNISHQVYLRFDH